MRELSACFWTTLILSKEKADRSSQLSDEAEAVSYSLST